MTELDMEKERREFEAWQSEGGADLTRAIGCQQNYSDLETNCEWYGWLAAKRAAMGSVQPVHFFRQKVGGRWIECEDRRDPREWAPAINDIFEYRTLYTAPPSTDAKDSERLDFMLLGKRYVAGNTGGDRFHVREIDQFGDSKRIHTDWQQTHREAIDAAIAAKEAK